MGCTPSYPFQGLAYYTQYFAILEEDYEYTATEGTCAYFDLSSTDAMTVGDGYINVAPNDKDAMKAALALTPLSIAMSVNQDVLEYRGGVYDNAYCGTQLNHAAMVVGWGIDDDSVEYWTVRNSWGTGWGEDGYMRVAIVDGAGICGVQMEPLYPKMSLF